MRVISPAPQLPRRLQGGRSQDTDQQHYQKMENDIIAFGALQCLQLLCASGSFCFYAHGSEPITLNQCSRADAFEF